MSLDRKTKVKTLWFTSKTFAVLLNSNYFGIFLLQSDYFCGVPKMSEPMRMCVLPSSIAIG